MLFYYQYRLNETGSMFFFVTVIELHNRNLCELTTAYLDFNNISTISVLCVGGNVWKETHYQHI